MATPLTSMQTAQSQRLDHHTLVDAAIRCYSNASKRNEPELLAKAYQLAYQAWQSNGEYIPGINLLARIATHRGDISDAQHWVDLGLNLNPESTGLLYSGGHIALTRNNLDLAEEYFQSASRISRVSTKAPIFLAHVKLLKGEYVEAFQHYRELAKTHADDPQVRNKLLEAASHIIADFYSQELEEEILRWFDFDDVDYNDLRSLTVSLLKHKLKLSESGCPIEPAVIAQDPLLLKAMSHFYFCDPIFERLLLTLRQSILLSSSRKLSIDSEYLPLVIATAHQIELNESVWYISQQEQSLVDQLVSLAEKILTLDTVKSEDISGILLLIMMYQPLKQQRIYQRLVDLNIAWPDTLTGLMSVAIQQVEEMRIIGERLPSLGTSDNQTSKKVQSQYEEHPYPRWTSLGYNHSADYYASLQALFPNQLNDLKPTHGRINALVAGCGTGRHALRLARYFDRMQVTAMDLSVTSLSYAQWQAQRYQLDINFIQGDILLSERLEQTFDVIESSGVLHHMKDPALGLEALVKQLNPGGVMKLALYSRQARTLVSELRHELQGNIPETDTDIRCVRETLLQQNSDNWGAIFQSSDFYSISACRDLLFHTQEHVFDLQQVRRLIENAGLEWVGIVPPAGARQLAADVLKLEPAHLTLNDWHTLEQIEPALFAGMYQFYVRKPAGHIH